MVQPPPMACCDNSQSLTYHDGLKAHLPSDLHLTATWLMQSMWSSMTWTGNLTGSGCIMCFSHA